MAPCRSLARHAANAVTALRIAAHAAVSVGGAARAAGKLGLAGGRDLRGHRADRLQSMAAWRGGLAPRTPAGGCSITLPTSPSSWQRSALYVRLGAAPWWVPAAIGGGVCGLRHRFAAAQRQPADADRQPHRPSRRSLQLRPHRRPGVQRHRRPRMAAAVVHAGAVCAGAALFRRLDCDAPGPGRRVSQAARRPASGIGQERTAIGASRHYGGARNSTPRHNDTKGRGATLPRCQPAQPQ